ncbi:Rho Gtpase-Activating Protein 8 [Manis pentadactyla]|nr:Rho Gtpase-Activating Protein 8 [Manis pentadactyla]
MRVSLGCEDLSFPETHKGPGEDDSKPGLMASLRLLGNHQTRSRNSSRSLSSAYSGLSLMVLAVGATAAGCTEAPALAGSATRAGPAEIAPAEEAVPAGSVQAGHFPTSPPTADTI